MLLNVPSNVFDQHYGSSFKLGFRHQDWDHIAQVVQESQIVYVLNLLLAR